MPLRSWSEDTAFLSPEKTSLAEVIHHLPSSEQCDTLIQAYFRGYHTMKPLFNISSFLGEVQQLQTWYDTFSIK